MGTEKALEHLRSARTLRAASTIVSKTAPLGTCEKESLGKSGEGIAEFAGNRSFEDAVQKHVGRSADTARVGACATSSRHWRPAKGHGDSLTAAARVRAARVNRLAFGESCGRR